MQNADLAHKLLQQSHSIAAALNSNSCCSRRNGHEPLQASHRCDQIRHPSCPLCFVVVIFSRQGGVAPDVGMRLKGHLRAGTPYLQHLNITFLNAGVSCQIQSWCLMYYVCIWMVHQAALKSKMRAETMMRSVARAYDDGSLGQRLPPLAPELERQARTCRVGPFKRASA